MLPHTRCDVICSAREVADFVFGVACCSCVEQRRHKPCARCADSHACPLLVHRDWCCCCCCHDVLYAFMPPATTGKAGVMCGMPCALFSLCSCMLGHPVFASGIAHGLICCAYRRAFGILLKTLRRGPLFCACHGLPLLACSALPLSRLPASLVVLSCAWGMLVAVLAESDKLVLRGCAVHSRCTRPLRMTVLFSFYRDAVLPQGKRATLPHRYMPHAKVRAAAPLSCH